MARKTAPRRLDLASNLTWALLILAVGVIWLLSILGVLPPIAVDLLQRGWPALLITFGLILLIGRRVRLGNLLAILVPVLMVGVVTVIAYTQQSGRERTDYTEPVAFRVVQGVQRIRATLNLLTTSIEIRQGTDQTISGQFVGSLESKVVTDFQVSSDGVATFVLREEPRNAVPLLTQVGRGKLTLTIPPGVAFEEFRLTGADGNLILDLSTNRVSRLNIVLGAGAIDLKLSDQSGTIGDIKTGRGDTTISIPPAVVAEITLIGTRADATKFNAERFIPNNNVLLPRVAAGVSTTMQLKIESPGAITIN